jgi:uncharacterized protein (TIGR03382 family)
MSDVRAVRVTGAGAVADPVVICSVAGGQWAPSVAAVDSRWLVTWADGRNLDATFDVYARFIDSSGHPDGAEVWVGRGDHPAIAEGGAGALIAWEDTLARHVSTRVVEPSGAFADPVSAPRTADTLTQYTPAVAWSGTSWIVAWEDYRGGAPRSSGILAGRLDETGAAIDTDPIFVSAAAGDRRAPAVAWGRDAWLVAWQDERDFGADVYAARVRGDGTIPAEDQDGFPVATGPDFEGVPSVAFIGEERWLVAYEGFDAAPGVNSKRVFVRTVTPPRPLPAEGGGCGCTSSAAGAPLLGLALILLARRRPGVATA